jgi:hypothetical protein
LTAAPPEATRFVAHQKTPSHAKEHRNKARVDRIRARPPQHALTAPGAVAKALKIGRAAGLSGAPRRDAYKAGVKLIPDAKEKFDPWRNAR